MSAARRWLLRAVVRALVALFALPATTWAQATEPLSAQRLGRPYVFVFVAYAIVLGLIGAFVVSIALRLARVEKRLQAD